MFIIIININMNKLIISICITLLILYIFYIINKYFLNKKEKFTIQTWTPNYLDINFQPSTLNNIYGYYNGYFYPI
jgi:hypothetical protein